MKIKKLFALLITISVLAVLLAIGVSAEEDVLINETNFPDANFRTYVASFDTNSSGGLSTAERNNVTQINVTTLEVYDLKGVEHFPNLSSLRCNNGYLERLDLTKNTKIKYLYCQNSSLTSLDLSNVLSMQAWQSNDQTRDIVSVRGTVDMSDYGVVAQMKGLSGGTLSGTVLTLDPSVTQITYDYQTGYPGAGMTVTLNVTEDIDALPIDTANFPDPAFRAFVEENFNTDSTAGLTAAEIAAVQSITLDGTVVGALKGIEHFTALEALSLTVSELLYVDLSANTALIPESVSLGTSTASYIFEAEQLDMSTLVPDITKLEIEQGGSMDSNGIVSFDNLVGGIGTLTYTYASSCGDVKLAATVTFIKAKKIDEANFPDLLFRNFVEENLNTDGAPGLSDAELAAVTSLEIDIKEIKSFVGIELFANLQELSLTKPSATSLDLSKNTSLERLEATGGKIKDINLTGLAELVYLDISGNDIREIELSSNTALEYLCCSENELLELSLASNTALTALYANKNYYIDEIDLSANTLLESLNLGSCDLSEIDLSQNTALEFLCLENNYLTSLDLTANTALTDVYLEYNSAYYSFDEGVYTLDLTTLPGYFDPTRVSELVNGSIEGNIFTVENPNVNIAYNYDVGGGFDMYVVIETPKLLIESIALSIDPELLPPPTLGGAVWRDPALFSAAAEPYPFVITEVSWYLDSNFSIQYDISDTKKTFTMPGDYYLAITVVPNGAHEIYVYEEDVTLNGITASIVDDFYDGAVDLIFPMGTLTASGGEPIEIYEAFVELPEGAIPRPEAFTYPTLDEAAIAEAFAKEHLLVQHAMWYDLDYSYPVYGDECFYDYSNYGIMLIVTAEYGYTIADEYIFLNGRLPYDYSQMGPDMALLVYEIACTGSGPAELLNPVEIETLGIEADKRIFDGVVAGDSTYIDRSVFEKAAKEGNYFVYDAFWASEWSYLAELDSVTAEFLPKERYYIFLELWSEGGYIFSEDNAENYKIFGIAPVSLEIYNGGNCAYLTYFMGETGEPHTHDFSIVRANLSEHWYECSCGALEGSYAPHSGGSATCAALAKCESCGMEHGEYNLSAHSYTETAHSMTEHWTVCTVCRSEKPESRSAHSGGAASCTALAKCDSCGIAYGALVGHSFGEAFLSDAEAHWHECACGEAGTKEPHALGEDLVCDSCAYDTTPPPTYTVSLTGGTPSGGESTKTVTAGESVTAVAAAPESGMRFVGWQKGEELVSRDVSYSFIPTENVSITAIYEPIPTEGGTGGEQGGNTSGGDSDSPDGGEQGGNTSGGDTNSPDGGEQGTDVPKEDDGFPTAGAVAIAVGGTLLLEAGIFSLVWFVIKKKSLKDLFSVFK